MNQNKSGLNIVGRIVSKPGLAGIFSFLFFVFIGYFLLWQRFQILNEGEQLEMSNIINLVENNIGQSLHNSYSVALSLALLVDDEGNIDNFEEIAPQLIDGNTNIDVVQLVPGGIITKVYPLEGNREVINYNILQENSQKREANKAIETREIYFAGPFELKQGGIAVVGRLPVFIQNEFWGFSVVIIKLENLLKQSGVKKLAGGKYQFQFSKKDVLTGEEIFFLPEIENLDTSYLKSVVMPDGDWKIYITSKNPNAILFLMLPIGFLILILAAWLGWITTKVLKQPAKLQELLKKKAGELVQSELKFRTIFDQAAIGIARLDSLSGKILETNTKYGELLGYTPKELSRFDYMQLNHPEDTQEDYNNMQMINSGEIREYTINKRIIKKNGDIGWVKLTVSTLRENGLGPEEHVALIEDITEKRLSELNLKKSYQMVKDQNKRLLNFSFIVSHNLRSHSSNIQAILNLYEMAESEDEKESYIQLLSKVGVALNQTLFDLNEVVAIQSNSDLIVEPLLVPDYLKMTLDLLQFQIQKKKAVIRQEIPEEMRVNFNAAYLESVLLNFLTNALRYCDHQRIPEILISGTRENGSWVLEISDNGIGIDMDKHGDQLFGMYKTFTDRPKSRGIGLFITKNQMNAMGGRVTVESRVDVGTTFKLHFK
jgi:PAS domain S-box-containing protein